MGKERILAALQHAGDVKIVVFGDYTLDKYLYSDPARDETSVETGLPAYQVHRQFLCAGVGGTITNNLCALGASIRCIGSVGSDGEGYALLKCLRSAGADVSAMVQTDRLHTCTYMKPMHKGNDGNYRETNRFDLRNFQEPPAEIQQMMMERLLATLDWADGVIITDQFFQRNMGAVTDWMRTELSALAEKRKDKIFFVDSRSFAGEYRNMIVKCNNIEFFADFGIQTDDAENFEEIVAQGQTIRERLRGMLFVTCGEKGMLVFDGAPRWVPAFPVSGPVDTVGAGDATNAGIVLGLALRLTPEEAATLACCISSITIQQLGETGTATPGQVAERLRE